MSRSALKCQRCGYRIGWTRSGQLKVKRDVPIEDRLHPGGVETTFTCPRCKLRRTWESETPKKVHMYSP